VSLSKLLGLLAFILSIYILWQVRQLLLLVFAAVVLATALNRLARRFQKAKVKRVPAVFLSMGILLTVFIGFFVLIVPPFIDQFQQLTELLPLGLGRVDEWVDFLEARLPRWMARNLPDLDSLVQQLQPVASRVLRESLTVFSSSLAVVVKLLLVLVLTMMFLVNPQAYRQTLIQLFPAFYRRRAEGILDQCETALGGWLVGILVNMSVITVLSFTALMVLRVPLAFAHAILAGLLTFIPNIGPTLSVVPPMTIALLDAPWKAGVVLLLYVVIQQFESNLLTPYVMAQQVSLLPAITLLSQLAFASLFGFLGLLLALPLTVVAQVWLQEAVIKDVLDRWRHPKRQPLAEVASEEAGDRSPG
jgi:predicted PurR-regulated permease PerM